MQRLELAIPPVALVVLVGLAMAVVTVLMPAASFPVPARPWFAGALLLAGALIPALGVREFRRAATTVDPRFPDRSTRVVRSGVYRCSRNPMYLGFLLALVGWGLLLANLVAFLFLPLYVLYMNRFQIVPEERFLQEKFGDAYATYRRRVRRWI